MRNLIVTIENRKKIAEKSKSMRYIEMKHKFGKKQFRYEKEYVHEEF